METENIEKIIQITDKLKKINKLIKETHPQKWKTNMEPFKEAIHITMCINKSNDIIMAMGMIIQRIKDPLLICWLEATAYQMMLDKHNVYTYEH